MNPNDVEIIRARVHTDVGMAVFNVALTVALALMIPSAMWIFIAIGAATTSVILLTTLPLVLALRRCGR